MSIVAFKLTGDYAHFSHPATIYSSLTYPVPPKTAIMGFLGAIIGEEEYFKLRDILYSVKIENEIVKKTLVFNGIKFALDKNINIERGYQNTKERKQFYRELICSPEYTIFVDLSKLSNIYQESIKHALKNHQAKFTPYLGINFCIADFEWVEVDDFQKILDSVCRVNTFTLQEDFEFEIDCVDVRLTTARMACDVEEGRYFKNFQDFVIEISGKNNTILSQNKGNIYRINGDKVYFV